MMTVSISDFGMTVTGTLGTYNHIYMGMPVMEAPAHWCNQNTESYLRKYMRIHCDVPSGGAPVPTLTATARLDSDGSNTIKITQTFIVDAWDDTFANAEGEESHPEGIVVKNTMNESVAPRWYMGWVRISKNTGSQDVNGIEFSARHDQAYADRNVELCPRSGASRQHLAKDGLSSWEITWGLIESYNRLVYNASGDKAAWRISFPLMLNQAPP